MKKIILLISIISSSALFSKPADTRIKMYALYTPSHKILVDKYFLPSIKDNFNLIIDTFKQQCPTGQFNSEGWNTTMLDKVDVIINAIKSNKNKIFIFSDVDIIFIRPVEKELKKLMKTYEFVIQKSSEKLPNCCTGFFAMIGNEKNLKLWIDIKKFMLKNPKLSEEDVLNFFIKQGRLNNIKWSQLPKEYNTGGMFTGSRWVPGIELQLPENILLHHANWTVGIDNKIAQLEYVLKKTK
ncbi:MAG: putative nucleotide-diphospho-sugar transferase [Candidatus Babeliales bacterium]|nr:putative nucleotide-diphospho-sugar transferase [Candidatus Babeliales bacterium]